MPIDKSISQDWLNALIEKHKGYFNSGELEFIKESSVEIIVLIKKKWDSQEKIEASIDAFIEWLKTDAIEEISFKGRSISNMPHRGLSSE